MNNKKMTPLLAAGVAATMCATLGLAGCGGDGNRTNSEGKPIIKVTLIKRSTQIDAADMKLTQDLEAACDCEIEWEEILDTQWAQQASTVLASGDVGDITIWGYNADNFAQYDYWEDLSDDIDSMPNVKEYFETVPEAKMFASDLDGHVWQIPSDYGAASGAQWSSGQNMMINKTWLDKLGLEMPKTWDELTEVLTAFKNEDPNGNGEADEVPMLINQLGTVGFGWWSPFLLLNGTGQNTQVITGAGAQGIYVKDGKIGNWMLSDNFRQVIEYYHSLIEAGLMPADVLTRDASLNTADINSDGKTAKVGLIFGWNTGNFGDLRDEYVSMEVPAAPGVSYEETTWEPKFEDIYNGACVKAGLDEEHKAAALKMIDAWLDPELTMESYYGDLGTYIEKDANDENTYNVLKFQDDLSTFGLADRGLTWVRPGVTVTGDEDKVLAEEDGKVYEEQQSHVDEDDIVPDYVRLSTEDNTTVSNNNSTIWNYALPQISTWIQDGGLTDETWNQYIETLKSSGIEENIELWQKWYDEYMAKAA